MGIYKYFLLLIGFMLFSCAEETAQSTADSIVSRGLIAFYPFNGNTNDESGNGYQGEAKGVSLTADRFGKANSAYSFDGSDDYIQLPEGFSDFTSGITMSFWALHLSTTGKWTRYVELGNGPNSDNILLLKWFNSNALEAQIRRDSDNSWLWGGIYY